jgi:hypothetical protein
VHVQCVVLCTCTAQDGAMKGHQQQQYCSSMVSAKQSWNSTVQRGTAGCGKGNTMLHHQQLVSKLTRAASCPCNATPSML